MKWHYTKSSRQPRSARHWPPCARPLPTRCSTHDERAILNSTSEPAMTSLSTTVSSLLSSLEVPDSAFAGGTLVVRSPIDGQPIGSVAALPAAQVDAVVRRAQDAFAS